MALTSWTWRGVAVVLTLCVQVLGYPGGAPQSTCGDLTPRHLDNQPQLSESPYKLSSAIQRVVEGNKLRLVLTSPTGRDIRGFMVQAKAPGIASGAIGSFNDVPGLAKTLTCGSGIRNTLTHTNKEVKKNIEVEWEPPAGFSGNVIFNSTFLTDVATFWVGVESEPVQVVKRAVPSQDQGGKGISTTKIPIRATTESNYAPTSRPQATTKVLHKIYTGCGDQKNCFGIPDGCATDGSGACSVIVAVSMSPSPPNLFTFELLGTNSPGYVGVGLSDDASMGGDQVVQCTSAGIGFSQNVGKDNQAIPAVKGVTLLNSGVTDGNLYCSFTRDAVTTVGGTKYDLKNTAYFLLIAKGDIVGDGKIDGHTDKSPTGSALLLSQVTEVGAKSNLLYRLHGTFMLAAWIGCAGTGMIFARYFKKTWVGKQVCGKDIWFSTHRALMIMTWTLTNAAFVIIFVEVGGWYGETSNPHAVLGVITTALCFIQPIAANFRPAPSDSKRPIFNWSHWGIGNLAHLLAVITIFFARQLSKADLPEWNDYIVATYVAFHVFMHILFSITDYCSQRPPDGRGNNFPMKEMGGQSRMNTFSDNSLDAPLTCLRRLLLTLYLVVVIALTIALIVVAAMGNIEENETFKQIVSKIKPLLMPNSN